MRRINLDSLSFIVSFLLRNYSRIERKNHKMTMIASFLLFVPVSAAIYNVVLTIFRYSTWEVENLYNAYADTFIFVAMVALSYLLSSNSSPLFEV